MSKPFVTNLPTGGVAVFAGGTSMTTNMALTGNELPQGSKPLEEFKGSYDFAPADVSNDMFEKMITDAEANTILTPGITFKAEMIYGGGIGVKKVKSVDYGERSCVEVYHPEFESFYRKCRFYEHFMAACKDFTGLASAYYQISLNGPGDKIMLITAHNSRCRNTRLGWKDDRGRIKSAYINADFGRQAEKQTTTKVLPLIQTVYDPAAWLREYITNGGTARHFIYPVQYIALGAHNYYPIPDWNAARISRWLEVSKKIALMKEFMIDNIRKLKYQVDVHPDYWPMRFGQKQWDGWSETEQLSNMQNEAVRIDEYFKGIEGGNVLMTSKVLQGFNKEAESMMTITEFKQFFVDGVHVEDSQEAAANILFAIGLHTSIFGSGSSKGLGNSGSENKYAFNQRKGLVTCTREQLLSPLYMLADYNGWGQDIEFFVRDTEDLKSDSEVAPAMRDNQIPQK